MFWIKARPLRPVKNRDCTPERRHFGLVIDAYETELQAEIPENVATLTAVDDDGYRSDGTLRVSTRLSRYKSTVLAPDAVELTTPDDETPFPTVGLALETSTIAEGVAPTFTVTRLYDTTGGLSLKYRVSEIGHDRVKAFSQPVATGLVA